MIPANRPGRLPRGGRHSRPHSLLHVCLCAIAITPLSPRARDGRVRVRVGRRPASGVRRDVGRPLLLTWGKMSRPLSWEMGIFEFFDFALVDNDGLTWQGVGFVRLGNGALAYPKRRVGVDSYTRRLAVGLIQGNLVRCCRSVERAKWKAGGGLARCERKRNCSYGDAET
ncbi:uncharacterized protein BKA78DRAFT_186145 [Phyllosticta capitalensis]|uniref:uncharacterized protein n=1 Tax=Phyllosticta capitalensis TaxID=121624 RepID=UPI0031300FC9